MKSRILNNYLRTWLLKCLTLSSTYICITSYQNILSQKKRTHRKIVQTTSRIFHYKIGKSRVRNFLNIVHRATPNVKLGQFEDSYLILCVHYIYITDHNSAMTHWSDQILSSPTLMSLICCNICGWFWSVTNQIMAALKELQVLLLKENLQICAVWHLAMSCWSIIKPGGHKILSWYCSVMRFPDTITKLVLWCNYIPPLQLQISNVFA